MPPSRKGDHKTKISVRNGSSFAPNGFSTVFASSNILCLFLSLISLTRQMTLCNVTVEKASHIEFASVFIH